MPDYAISQSGLDFIKRSENEPLFTGAITIATLYEDNNHPAIGYGCDLSEDEVAQYDGHGITEPQASDLLSFRVNNAVIPAIQKFVTVPLTQGQVDALCSFVYNLGPVTLESSTLLRKLNSGDYAGAQAQFALWDHVNGVPNAGLLARRQGEAEMFGNAGPEPVIQESSD